MEQPNQQPIQEQRNLHSGKKFLEKHKLPLIVAIIVIVLVLGGILLLKLIQSGPDGNVFSLPVITLEYQGKTYEGVQGSYCWPIDDEEDSTLCADTMFPESSETIVVKQGDELAVLIDAAKTPQTVGISTLVYLDQPAVRQLSLAPELNSIWKVDHPLGTYFVLVSASWEEGDIGYGFKIDVQPQAVLDTSAWQTYRNDEYGFELEYPKESLESSVVFEEGIVRFDLPKKDGTNLSRKYLEIVGRSVATNAECINPVHTIIGEQALVRIGGIEFIREMGGDAGLGTSYETHSYSAFRSGKCISLVFGLNSASLENYDPSIRPKEFNRDQEGVVFDQILSTFRFVEPLEVQPTIEWNWEPLGCGGQTPCSYRVSSSQLSGVYMCAGKYNPLSGQGEVTPTPSTDPRTTTDFTCQLEE